MVLKLELVLVEKEGRWGRLFCFDLISDGVKSVIKKIIRIKIFDLVSGIIFAFKTTPSLNYAGFKGFVGA